MNTTQQVVEPRAASVATGSGNGRPVVEPPVLGGSEHTDFYQFDKLLTDDQRELRQRVRQFMDSEVLPIINPYWERAEFPHELVPKMAELGIAVSRSAGTAVRG
jgi:glutaryl-CoA dehydrogenase